MDDLAYWESVVHQLRVRGYSRTEAEDEADTRLEKRRLNAAGHSHPRAAKPLPPAQHGRGNHDTGE